MDAIGGRIAALTQEMRNGVSSRLTAIEGRISNVEVRLDDFETKLDDVRTYVMQDAG